MIPSTRIIKLHQLFTDVTPWEWTFFVIGAVAGILVWVWIYRAVLRGFIQRLYRALQKDVLGILAQALLGAAILIPNTLLFNLGEVDRNFLVAAFALTGMLFGLWVIIPEEP